ncbi:hypothetical protein [Xanthomarina gelatinilytica]|uniref:hypothetical protein n=1 Tax=Xanthomarina gelatinilytica TaxID=1137281 RepID=UPI003AA965B3
MKKLLIIFYLIAYTSCTSLNFDGLYGHPKKVESIDYEVIYKDTIEIITKDNKSVTLYDYNLRSKKSFSFSPPNYSPLPLNYSYFYDKKGNIIKTIISKGDSIIRETTYKYNKYGLRTENTTIKNGIKSTFKVNIDLKNRIKIIDNKNSDGSFKYYARVKYDKKWNKIESISYDSLGKQKVRIKNGYDKNGNVNSSKWYNDKNMLYYHSKTVFNKNNDPILASSIRIKNSDTIKGKVTSFKYKYDKKNNIIERRVFHDDVLVLIIETKYEY